MSEVSFIRQVVVFDAADISAESAFWGAMLGGRVVDNDDRFHVVIDGEGQWRIGVQLAPDHVKPDWPDGEPQQVHLDLHVEDGPAAHARALELGAVVLYEGDTSAAHDHNVYADPAGHPFCIGWGQATHDQLAAFLAKLDE